MADFVRKLVDHRTNLGQSTEKGIKVALDNLEKHESVMVEATVLLRELDWAGEGLVGKLDGKIGYVQHFNLRGNSQVKLFNRLDESSLNEEHFESALISFVAEHDTNQAIFEVVSTHKNSIDVAAKYLLTDLKVYIR
jgi:hypothetical protein